MSNPRVARLDEPVLVDAGIAVLVAAAMVGGTLLVRGPGPDPAGYVLLVATAAPLAYRRRLPVPALLAVAALAFAYDVSDRPGAFYTLPLAVALFSVADAGRRLVAAGAVAAIVGGFLAVGLAMGRGHVVDLANAAWFAGWLVASAVLGEVVRGRRAFFGEAQRRALEAERGRAEEARRREEEALRRAGEERIRIARELHDVLAHRISTIAVQAGVGAHLLDRDPEQARAALTAIGEASRQALRELRATLGVLRQADEAAPRAPAPGLGQLDDLVRDAGAAGIDVRVDVAGEPCALPPALDLAAYRIIQESLTNVIRHARARVARVAVTYEPACLSIEVVDDGVGATDGASRVGGNGLLGMRERALAAGGELAAGPRPEGGFAVHARLPFARPAPAGDAPS